MAFRLSKTLSTALILAVTLPLPALATLQASRVLQHTVRLQREVREAEVLANRGLRLVIDAETGVRGYTSTGDPVFLQPYHAAVGRFGPLKRRLEQDLRDVGLPEAIALLDDARRTRREWTATVAEPLIRAGNRRPNVALQLRGKALVDHVRDDQARMQRLIADRGEAIDADASAAMRRIVWWSLLAAALIGALALIGGAIQHRLRGAIDRRRAVAEALQRAFGHEAHRLPETDVGTAYLSATSDAAFGGDLFDVRCLDEHRAYVLIADVSGKGFEAAADATFVKHAVETLARRHEDPGAVLSDLNRLYADRTMSEEAFVVAFLATIDYRAGRCSYASAGHSPAYLRRAADHSIEQLRVTGPIIGLLPEQRFRTARALLQPGDTLVLATDGLTEARDRQGEMLTDDGVMRWIKRSDGGSAQELVDELVRRRARFAAKRQSDDLAIVALRFNRPRTNEAACIPEPIPIALHR